MLYFGITLDLDRDSLLSPQSKELLAKHYMLPDEPSPQYAFARAALAYGSNREHAQRLYDAASKLWFMFSSPVLSNAPAYWDSSDSHGLPISCYLTYVPDTILGQQASMMEVATLSVVGGGVGAHNGIRAISEKAPGPIPFMKVLDAEIGYFRQGRTRRGSLAYYMDIDHPDIVEHINFRKRSGGDAARKADNKKAFHVAVNIPDAFMEAALENKEWALKCPHTKIEHGTVSARSLWEMVLESRSETGEPYIHWIDESNRQLPTPLKDAGLEVRGSNLCSEITLPTGPSYTAVCCLSSLNLEYYDEWKGTSLVRDLIEMLDNVMEEFIKKAQYRPYMGPAAASAKAERSLGLGAMGFHSYLQRHGIPFEGGGVGSAVQINAKMFKHIKQEATYATEQLAISRGEPDYMRGTGKRNAHLLAIAPNSNSSTLAGCSPSIEPWVGNCFVATTRAGAYIVKNKYLQQALALRGLDTDEVWQSVLKNDGSIAHLDVGPEIKRTFKTAWEIDQHWVVEHAATRQPYICQAQSVNLFFAAGASRDLVNSVHLSAWKKKLKTLYYFRTTNKQRVDTVKEGSRVALEDWSPTTCIACEG